MRKPLLLVMLLMAPRAGLAWQAQDDRDALRQRWSSLTEEERRKVLDNLEKWRRMPPEERELMRRRHDSLERLRGQVDRELAQEESTSERRLDGADRRRFLDHRTRETLKALLESIPEDSRAALRAELEGLPAEERGKRMKEWIRAEIEQRLPEFLDRLEESGRLDPVQRLDLELELLEGESADRFLKMKKLLMKDPESFGVPPELRERFEESERPLGTVRLLHEMRGPSLGLRFLERYLREHGVPEEDLAELREAPPEQREQRTRELMREHKVPPPDRIIQSLRGRGVSRDEIRELFEGGDGTFRERLERLRASRRPAPGSEQDRLP